MTSQPPNARRVFLDSSSFLSLVNPKDDHHQAAKAIWTRLSQEQWHTFTTNFLVAETHALFIIRLDHRRARDFLREITQSSTVILRVSPQDEEQGRAIVLRYDDKDFSLTDATSFVIMERLRIPYAFTFDRHFTQYGLPVLS
jgi:predicted nucleic acid-binding protein